MAAPTLRASVSADGLVILDIQEGVVLAANAIGARIWQLLEERRTVADIAALLARDYAIPDERARHDVDAFIASLLARGLLHVVRA